MLTYAETAKDYAAAVTAKQLPTAIADTITLSQTCAAEGKLPASGDAELDAAWHRFADGCVTGWNDITQAFQQRDKTLLAQGRAALKAASDDYLVAGKRMIALGQQALAGATAPTG